MEGTDRIEVGHQIVTIPNILSFIRLLLVPVFLVLILRRDDFAALIVLAVSSATDYFDGQIARRLGQVTRLGQLLDPAADRLFIFSSLIGLSVTHIIPWWFGIIVIGRDVMLAVLGVILANHGFGPLPVHHLGKFGTFSLLYALPILMLGAAFHEISSVADPIGWAFALWGAFIYWWAGAIYLRETAMVIRIPRGVATTSSDTLGG
jgi:cardiolipin synthase